MEHQAVQIVSVAKYFGGAVCARPQVIVTCKNWPQRQAFLDCIAQAARDLTPAATSFYPGSGETFAKFQAEYPQQGQVIEPETGKYGESSRFLWIPGIDNPDGFLCQNEAFTQVLGEFPLDTPSNAKDFLNKAVPFCNEHLFGSLDCTILIDGKTQKSHNAALEEAVTDLKYGALAVNGAAAMAWCIPYLIWGGCGEEGKPIESGRGHFGNLFGFETIEKCIIYDQFVTPAQLVTRNKKVFEGTLKGLAQLALRPSWYNHFAFVFRAIVGSFKSKDF
jgi:hypothetical protein